MIDERNRAQASVEQELAALLLEGAIEQAATLAIRRYGPEIFGYLVNTMNDASAADEIYAQFIEDLWRGIQTFRPNAQVRTWAYVIARSARARYCRGVFRRREQRLLTEQQERLKADTINLSKLRETPPEEKLLRVRAQLSAEDRELLTLRLDRQLQWDEIARIIDINVPAARQRYRRIKKKIRVLLDES